MSTQQIRHTRAQALAAREEARGDHDAQGLHPQVVPGRIIATQASGTYLVGVVGENGEVVAAYGNVYAVPDMQLSVDDDVWLSHPASEEKPKIMCLAASPEIFGFHNLEGCVTD